MSISPIGSSSYVGAYGGVSTGSTPAIGESSPKDEFLRYQSITPAQKMRAAMLSKLGLTKDKLKAMSPEDRKKVEDRIKDMIKQQVENDPDKKNKNGLVANVLA